MALSVSTRHRWPTSALPLAGLGLAVIAGLVMGAAAFNTQGPLDTDAYWRAALRLREGSPLYPAVGPNADDVYRYAPWFAWAWVPLTYVPQGVVYPLWSGTLAVAAIVAIRLTLKRSPDGLALSAISLGSMLYAAGYGNPTPLLILALVGTRLHPAAIGVAGSLKVYPLLLLAGYAAERRWRDCAEALAVAAVLWLPALAYGLDNYVLDPGSGGISLFGASPLAWAGIAITALVIGTCLIVRRSGFSWAIGPTLILTCVPRLWLSDIAYLISALRVPKKDGEACRT